VLLAALNRAQGEKSGRTSCRLVIWVCVLKSACTRRCRRRDRDGDSAADGDGTARRSRLTEHALHPWVAFVVLPMFAFANAGVSLQGVSLATLAQGFRSGIALRAGARQGDRRVRRVVAADAADGVRPAAARRTRQFFGVCVGVVLGHRFTIEPVRNRRPTGGLRARIRSNWDRGSSLAISADRLIAGMLGSMLLLTAAQWSGPYGGVTLPAQGSQSVRRLARTIVNGNESTLGFRAVTGPWPRAVHRGSSG
jgi:NhaA family Na+:H+ antiporter